MALWAQVHGLVMLHRSGRFAMKRKPYLTLCARSIDHVLVSSGVGVPTGALILGK